jgi:hypothetical protein
MKDASYDGEYIYFVPFENSSIKRTDSTLIANSEFQFEGSAKMAEIYIIRAKPLLRLTLQELLIVREPGEMIVTIDNNSRVSGTALNDSLQRWKEQKGKTDILYEELRQQFKLANETDRAVIKQKANSLNTLNVEFNYTFVLNNQANVVGKFVNKMMGNAFSPEQKKNLIFK